MKTLASEELIVEAPMSFTGSAKRIWKITATDNVLLKWLFLVWWALTFIALAWLIIFFWYLIFGIFLIPYRMIRRSQRNNRREKLRHEEVIAALKSNGHER